MRAGICNRPAPPPPGRKTCITDAPNGDFEYMYCCVKSKTNMIGYGGLDLHKLPIRSWNCTCKEKCSPFPKLYLITRISKTAGKEIEAVCKKSLALIDNKNENDLHDSIRLVRMLHYVASIARERVCELKLVSCRRQWGDAPALVGLQNGSLKLSVASYQAHVPFFCVKEREMLFLA